MIRFNDIQRRHIATLSRAIQLGLLVLMFSLPLGCRMFMPQRSVNDTGELPDTYSLETGKVQAPDQWWKTFQVVELDNLVDTALAENLSLRQAWARLEQVKASAVQTESAIYPDLSLEMGGSYERRKVSQRTEGRNISDNLAQTAANTLSGAINDRISNGLGIAGAGGADYADDTVSSGLVRVTSETKSYSLGLAASYEIDLWGRIWAERQSANFEVQASYEDVQSTAMTIAAEVTLRWLNILERRAQLDVLAEQLATNKTYLELVELRFNKSMVSALDVYQQQQAVEAIEKQIPLVRSEEQVLKHDLAVLLGQAPASEIDCGTYDIEKIPLLPKVGFPADILLNRPDVRAAYARLQVADYSVSAARADRLPAISLTGRAAYSSGELEFLIDDWVANLAANLTAPLFDGSRRKAEVERNRALVEERLANYRLVVLTAIQEVENAMVQERQQKEYMKALDKQLESAKNALREAGSRYRKGQNDYLPVLTALQTTQQLTRDVISARRQLIVYRVNLHRALGGSWAGDLKPSARLSEASVDEKTENEN